MTFFAFAEGTLCSPVLFLALERTVLVLELLGQKSSVLPNTDMPAISAVEGGGKRDTNRVSTLLLVATARATRTIATAILIGRAMLVFRRLLVAAVVRVTDVVLFAFGMIVFIAKGRTAGGAISIELFTLLDGRWGW